MDEPVVHMAPQFGESITPCCKRHMMDIRRGDRVTIYNRLVTCGVLIRDNKHDTATLIEKQIEALKAFKTFFYEVSWQNDSKSLESNVLARYKEYAESVDNRVEELEALLKS